MNKANSNGKYKNWVLLIGGFAILLLLLLLIWLRLSFYPTRPNPSGLKLGKPNFSFAYRSWKVVSDEKTGNSECTSAIESFRWPWRPKVEEFRLATNSDLDKVFGDKNLCNCDIYFEYGFDRTYFGHDWKYRFSGESVVPGGNNAIGTYKIENGKIIITSKKFTTFPKGAPNPYNTEELQYYIDKKGDFGILQKYIYQKTNSAKIENSCSISTLKKPKIFDLEKILGGKFYF